MKKFYPTIILGADVGWSLSFGWFRNMVPVLFKVNLLGRETDCPAIFTLIEIQIAKFLIHVAHFKED